MLGRKERGVRPKNKQRNAGEKGNRREVGKPKTHRRIIVSNLHFDGNSWQNRLLRMGKRFEKVPLSVISFNTFGAPMLSKKIKQRYKKLAEVLNKSNADI